MKRKPKCRHSTVEEHPLLGVYWLEWCVNCGARRINGNKYGRWCLPKKAGRKS